MKISKTTLDVLKNYATINQNIMFREGSVLQTINNAKTIYSKASVSEAFNKEFAIYDLNSLLGLFSFAEDADVTLGEEYMVVEFSGGTGGFKYRYSDPEIINTPPDKTIEVKEVFTFDLSKSLLEKVLKAASLIASPIMRIEGDGTSVNIKLCDPATGLDSTNTYDAGVIGSSDRVFKADVPVESLKVRMADYTVTVGSNPLLYLKSTNPEIEYWIAVERSSEF